MIGIDRPLAGALIVGLVAFLVYAPSLDGGFVYDDEVLLVRNEHVHRIEDPGRFFTDPTTLSAAGALHSYRPVRTLLFAVEWQVFGDRPVGYRVVSAALHALVALMLLALLRRWTGLPRGSLLAALLFAVHPVATECVPWTSIQGDLLSAGALLAALWFLEDPRPRRLAAGLTLFVVAAGAKESAVVLPGLVLIRLVWLPAEQRTRRRYVALAAVVGLAIAYAILRQIMVTGIAEEATAHRGWYGGSWARSLGAFLAGVVFYVGTVLLPVDLTIRWSPTSPPPGLLVMLGAAILLVPAFVSIRPRARRPIPAAGLLMAIVVLAPASSLLVPLPTITEIRYLYPILPFIALALTPFLERLRGPTVWVLIGLMAVLSVRRAQDWDSNDALWTAAAGRCRSTPEALLNVGCARLEAADRARRDRPGEELRHLLGARRHLLLYADERHPFRANMPLFERRVLVDRLTTVAQRLLELEQAESALGPAAASLDFGGPSPRRLRRLARILAALGRRAEAAQVQRDAERLETGR